jgi:alanine racemase
MPAARARLTIDLNALADNFRLFKRMTGAGEVAPVVKADGYGLGAGPVSRRLWAEGARGFFVARLEEGEALRDALGPDRPAMIHVFDGAPTGSAARLMASNLIPVLNSPSQVEVYLAFSRSHGNALPCGLHLDTGMNRLGLDSQALKALAESSDRLQGLKVALVMSHLACADQEEHPMNARQAGRFRKARALFPDARASLANSAGVFLGADYLHEITRPGIGLYGGGPFGKAHRDIGTVATLEAPILEVRTVATGETVGYGADFTAERPLRVAIVGAGYADGLMRAAWKTGRAWLGGALRPFVGRVSMDLLAIDVTDCDEAMPGAMVELLGPHVLLDDAAASAGTVSYEILTRLGTRAERIYIGAADA